MPPSVDQNPLSPEEELASTQAELAAVLAENEALTLRLGARSATTPPVLGVANAALTDGDRGAGYRSPDKDLLVERALAEARSALTSARVDNSILQSQLDTRHATRPSLSWTWRLGLVVSAISLTAGILEGNLGIVLVPILVYVVFAGIVTLSSSIPARDGPPQPPPRFPPG